MADKIIQDPRFLQQIFSHLSSEQIGGMNIAIVGELNITNEGMKFDFYDFLNSLPEPRMESLKKIALKIVLERLKSKTKTAEFLGISDRTLRSWHCEKEIKEIEMKEENNYGTGKD